jgi:DNA polymerase III alpha subunit (gram-positive type)
MVMVLFNQVLFTTKQVLYVYQAYIKKIVQDIYDNPATVMDAYPTLVKKKNKKKMTKKTIEEEEEDTDESDTVVSDVTMDASSVQGPARPLKTDSLQEVQVQEEVQEEEQEQVQEEEQVQVQEEVHEEVQEEVHVQEEEQVHEDAQSQVQVHRNAPSESSTPMMRLPPGVTRYGFDTVTSGSTQHMTSPSVPATTTVTYSYSYYRHRNTYRHTYSSTDNQPYDMIDDYAKDTDVDFIGIGDDSLVPRFSD